MPAQLSGGQQQRVAVARALVFDPAVVLMDEPLGALDKNLRESMQYEIKHIHENIGVTVVYVTHDQGEALTMSNRIAVFNDGKVQQLSSPDKLYEEPVNSFVVEFIGENNTFSLKDILSEYAKSKNIGIPFTITQEEFNKFKLTTIKNVMLEGKNIGYLAISENANDIKAAIDERKTFILRTAIAVGIVILIFSFVLNRYFLKPCLLYTSPSPRD